MARTQIGIISAGNMGRASPRGSPPLAAGHTVSITGTDRAHAESAYVGERGTDKAPPLAGLV